MVLIFFIATSINIFLFGMQIYYFKKKSPKFSLGRMWFHVFVSWILTAISFAL